jgi:hypothetical protein
MAKVRRVPAFPSTCQIFRGGPPGTGVQVYNGPCEKRVSANLAPYPLGAPPLVIYTVWTSIYLPAGTDVRGNGQPGGRDYVQWQGNPAWVYIVEVVEDIADGFTNKFRIAWSLQWSVPTPIP